MRTKGSKRVMPPIFRKRDQDDRRERLERELASLERQARTASAGYETQFLNRAGNLCAEVGEVGRALGYYGRAIDAYLETGRFSAAEVLGAKLLKLSPNAVRPRCTLAWLAIGKGHRSGSDEIDEYVRASRESAMEHLAVKQLAMMAEAAPGLDLRELIAEHLLDLGAFDESERVFAAVFEERSGLRPARREDQGKLWSKMLSAALMNPQALNESQGTDDDDEGGSDFLPSLGG